MPSTLVASARSHRHACVTTRVDGQSGRTLSGKIGASTRFYDGVNHSAIRIEPVAGTTQPTAIA